MFSFYLKKMISRAAFPLPLVLMLLLAAGILLLCPPAKTPRREVWRRRCGIGFLAAGIGLLLLGGIFGPALLKSYCGSCRPLTRRELVAAGSPLLICVTWGGGIAPGSVEVAERRIDPMSRMRLDEGCRLFVECEKAGIPCRLAVSAPGRRLSEERVAAVCAACARYGIAPERIVFVPGVLNSRDEVREFAKLPGRLILVSCASHLPRLRRQARRLGVADALVSACDVPLGMGGDVLAFVPSVDHFQDFECLVYELLGQAEIILFH